MVNFGTKRIMKQALIVFALVSFSISTAYAQTIVPDGTTDTTLHHCGSTIDVKTNTVKGINAFNSFKKFNVEENSTVNLILPSNTNNMINLVHGEFSEINGTLNTLKNNQVGGNLYFVNPYGVAVGPAGKINTGSLVAVAPSVEFMSKYLNPNGKISEEFTRDLLNGEYNINSYSAITISGEVNASGNVHINAGKVINHGQINTGATYAITYGEGDCLIDDIVNTNAYKESNKVVVKQGEVFILSGSDIIQNGKIITGELNMFAEGDIITPEQNGAQVIADSVNIGAGGFDGEFYVDSAHTNVFTSNGDINLAGKTGKMALASARDIKLNNVETTGMYAFSMRNTKAKNMKLSGEGHIVTADGYIHLKATLAEKDLYLSTRKGNATLDSVNLAGDTHITTGKGSTKFYKTLAQGEVDIKQCKGNVTASKTHFMNDVNITNGSGKVYFKDVFMQDTLNIENKGNITLKKINTEGKIKIHNKKGNTLIKDAYLQDKVYVKQDKGNITLSDANATKNVEFKNEGGKTTIQNALVEGKVKLVGCRTKSTIKNANIKKDTIIISHKGKVNVESAHLEGKLKVKSYDGNVNVNKVAIANSTSITGDKTDVVLDQTYLEKDLNIKLCKGNAAIAHSTVSGDATIGIRKGDVEIDNALFESDVNITLKNGVADIENTTIFGELNLEDKNNTIQ